MSGPNPPPVGGSYLGLLRRNSAFRRFYLASLISLAGDWFMTVALLDLIMERTGKAALATLVVVCMNLPVFLVTPWAGAQVDKMDRRKLMIGVDLVRALAALLPLLATTPDRLPLAYLAVCFISVGSAYFDPAADSAVPNLVAAEDLGRANAFLSSAWGTMMAAGASVGGLVTVYFGRTTSFLVNSATFLCSSLLLLTIRVPFSERDPSTKQHPPLAQALREAVAYARARPRVLALILGKSGYGLAAGTVALLSVFGNQMDRHLNGAAQGGGARGIALLLSARGLGAVLGPVVLQAMLGSAPREDDRTSFAVGPCIFIFGLGYLGLSLGYGYMPWLATACVLIAHMGGGGQWMAATYGLQREVTDELRGRVFAFDYGLVTLTISVSSLITGLVADRYGAVPVVMALALMSMVIAGIWMQATRKLWRL